VISTGEAFLWKLRLRLGVGTGDHKKCLRISRRPFLCRIFLEEVAPVRQLCDQNTLGDARLNVTWQLQAAGLRGNAAEIAAIFGDEVCSRYVVILRIDEILVSKDQIKEQAITAREPAIRQRKTIGTARLSEFAQIPPVEQLP